MNELTEILRAAAASVNPSALATILHARGSSFRRPGARLWLGAEGRVGSVSAGCLENDLAERSREIIESGQPRVISYDTSSDDDVLWGTASGCGGRLEILLEPWTEDLRSMLSLAEGTLSGRNGCAIVHQWDGREVRRAFFRQEQKLSCASELRATALEALASGLSVMTVTETGGYRLIEVMNPPIALTIFGAGEDSRRTAALGASLGWSVTMVHRSFAERNPSLEGVQFIPAISEGPPFDRRSAVVIMSHDYYHDAETLEAAVKWPVGYLGIVGPARRTVDLLRTANLPAQTFDRIHSPAGLDLGGETPGEIALSIVSEIQAVLNGHQGGPLKESGRPIHHPAISREPAATPK
jgi:xanthine dehydrogenase accessory factor